VQTIIKSLARSFFHLAREHSRVKHLCHNQETSKTARKARKECHKNIYAFSKKLLDGTDSNQLPRFRKEDAEDAEEFFSAAYCSESLRTLSTQSGCCPHQHQNISLIVVTSHSERSRVL